MQVFVGGRGLLNADTKLFLQTDPVGLMAASRHVWDPTQYAGYVAHQMIGYLWPSGPFYAVFGRVGLPAWVVQRLWLGMLFAFAGLGVHVFLRARGHGRTASMTAALLYQLSPYVLAYQSRTSVMLLPWAALGWLAVVTMRGLERRGWTWSAVAALILLTVGGINATSLILVIPALLVIAVEMASNGATSWRRMAVFGAQSALLGVVVSAWWMAMVVLQGRHGSRVLFFSESLEDVSLTATGFEVLRGMGYWLNYVGLGDRPITTAAARSLSSIAAIGLSLVAPVSGLIGVTLARIRERRLALMLIVVGVVLSVNVHPIVNASRAFSPLAANPDSWLSLALRSSTRAIPVMLLGLAIGVAALVDSLSASAAGGGNPPAGWTRMRTATIPPMLLVSCALLAVPTRFSDGVVDPALARRQLVAESWTRLGEAVELVTPAGYRVLQLPGQEFAAYRWGYTSESVLHAVQGRPALVRELLPVGDEQLMNFIGAVNDAALEGRLSDAKLRDIARLLGVGAVVFPGDLDNARYGTPSLTQLVEANTFTGLTEVGPHRMADLTSASAGVLRLETGSTVLLGDGNGLVAASGWNLLGDRAVFYAGDLTDGALQSAVAEASLVVVTDTNRSQAQHWRSTRDTLGFAEDGTATTASLRHDYSDRRLKVFSRDRPADRTLFEQRGPSTARATAYGETLSYLPERRAALAIDGILDTSWSVSHESAAQHARIVLTLDEPVDQLSVVQSQEPSRHRIKSVSISVDRGPWTLVNLDQSSLTAPGQVVPLPSRGREVRIEIASVGTTGLASASDFVGFAEIDSGRGPTAEVGVLPSRGTERVAPETPLAIVISRSVAPPWDPQRTDPEHVVRREINLAARRTFSVALRLDPHGLPDPPSGGYLTIDGKAVALAPSTTDPREMVLADQTLTLEPGRHVLVAGTWSAPVDQMLMTSGIEQTAPSPARSARMESMTGDPTDRRAVLEGSCKDPCWLVFGESYSDQWRLTVDGRDLGTPVRVDGGVNAWRVTGPLDGAKVVISFRAQKVADAAQLLSLAGALACLMIVARALRFRSAGVRPSIDGLRGVGTSSLTHSRHTPPSRARLLACGVVACGVLGWALLPDRWTTVVLLVTSAALWWRRPVDLARAAVGGVIAALGVGLLLVIHAPPPMSFGWPLAVDHVHHAIVAMLLVALVASCLEPKEPVR